MNNVKKYLHVSKNNADGKWKSILLVNLANEMELDELEVTYEELPPVLLKMVTEKLERIIAAGAPEIIVKGFRKKVTQVERGTHPDISNLRRAIKRKWS